MASVALYYMNNSFLKYAVMFFVAVSVGVASIMLWWWYTNMQDLTSELPAEIIPLDEIPEAYRTKAILDRGFPSNIVDTEEERTDRRTVLELLSASGSGITAERGSGTTQKTSETPPEPTQEDINKQRALELLMR